MRTEPLKLGKSGATAVLSSIDPYYRIADGLSDFTIFDSIHSNHYQVRPRGLKAEIESTFILRKKQRMALSSLTSRRLVRTAPRTWQVQLGKNRGNPLHVCRRMIPATGTTPYLSGFSVRSVGRSAHHDNRSNLPDGAGRNAGFRRSSLPDVRWPKSVLFGEGRALGKRATSADP